MSLLENPWVTGAAAFCVGSLVGYWLLRWKERNLRAAAALKEQALLESARGQAGNLVREARVQANEDALKLREQTEQSFAARRTELGQAEQRLTERESLITRQFETIVQEERNIRQQKEDVQHQCQALESEREKLKVLERERRDELARVGHLSESDARQQMLREVETESLQDANGLSRRILEEAKSRAEEKARSIISVAVQRYAGFHTFEISSATVALNGDDIKGRIIGREGRNIRAFEAATGVTVLIDDTPNAVVLSGFDPVRREIARDSMQRLILDGRIHPTRIEEVVAKVTQEMDETVMRAGEEAAARVGIPTLSPEVVRTLGRLKFRHSFSQNVLEHSVEVAQLTGLMAAELGLDVRIAKRAGLLHDIGKAVNHEVEGTHAAVGADLLRKHGECEEVCNAVAAHHDEVPHLGPLGILVSAADAISASRPGARSETLTTYIKRVEDLERIGTSFPGVEKCYAVQAGRELRVMVRPDHVTDEHAFGLARSISRRIEDELHYPGQIRVTVLRETRVVEYAK